MAHLVDRGQTTVRLLKLEVEPLHLLVVGTVVKQHRNGHRKEETVATATEARGDGAVLGRVRVSKETAKQGLVGVGRRRLPQWR
jgi:hypothetical protein